MPAFTAVCTFRRGSTGHTLLGGEAFTAAEVVPTRRTIVGAGSRAGAARVQRPRRSTLPARRSSEGSAWPLNLGLATLQVQREVGEVATSAAAAREGGGARSRMEMKTQA